MSLWVLFAFITIGTIIAFLHQSLSAISTTLDLARDLRDGQAAALEGRVSTSSDTEANHGVDQLYEEQSNRCWYAIGDVYLPVSEHAHKALRPYSGSSCRVFMTPRSRFLLSIEPVKTRRADRLVH